MNSIASRRRRKISAVFALAMAVVMPCLASAADRVNLDGTWKISAPQSSFKPLSGAVPFSKQGRERYNENKRYRAKGKYDEYDITMSRCSSPGLPRLMLTPDRFRIHQGASLIMFQFEWNRLTRQIDMGGLLQPQIRPTEDEAAAGRAVPISKGHWEGDILVVTTAGFSGNTLVDNLVPHGYDMKITERIRLVDANTLEDRITIEDAEFFVRPWETVVTYKRQPDDAFREDICLDRIRAGQPALSTK